MKLHNLRTAGVPVDQVDVVYNAAHRDVEQPYVRVVLRQVPAVQEA